ncbi:hypothetical protein IVA83_12195 [Bradyrhizobium sp. 143]|nr:hypothetical protein [Bradyrhizobium sp. 143]
MIAARRASSGSVWSAVSGATLAAAIGSFDAFGSASNGKIICGDGRVMIASYVAEPGTTDDSIRRT